MSNVVGLVSRKDMIAAAARIVRMAQKTGACSEFALLDLKALIDSYARSVDRYNEEKSFKSAINAVESFLLSCVVLLRGHTISEQKRNSIKIFGLLITEEVQLLDWSERRDEQTEVYRVFRYEYLST